MKKTFSFWFDLENAPDVLFFEPIVKCLREKEHIVYSTCRNYSDVPKLAKIYNIGGQIVGRYGGRSKWAKYSAGLVRSFLLMRWSMKKDIDLAVSFGSRPLILACGLRGIPNISIIDYEHVSISVFNKFCNWFCIPEAVPKQYFVERGMPSKKIIKFPGLKEDVYTNLYSPNQRFLEKLGFERTKIIATLRPPATSAHYHDHTSVTICRRILQKIADNQDLSAIFLRRDNDDTFDDFLQYRNIRQLERPVKGLDLVSVSDVVISGGGTMVREAASLGIPSYSIFTGKQGAVDAHLAQEGRLTLIRKPEDVEKISFKKHQKGWVQGAKNAHTLDFFVNKLIHLAEL